MVLFLHKKFLKPIIGGFITGGFEGAIRGGLQGLTGQRPRQVLPRAAPDRTFTSFQAAIADARRRRPAPGRVAQARFAARPPLRSPTPVSFGGLFIPPARRTFQFQPSGRDQIIQLVRRFCR